MNLEPSVSPAIARDWAMSAILVYFQKLNSVSASVESHNGLVLLLRLLSSGSETVSCSVAKDQGHQTASF